MTCKPYKLSLAQVLEAAALMTHGSSLVDLAVLYSADRLTIRSALIREGVYVPNETTRSANPVTADERASALAMHKEGKSNAEIAKTLGRAVETVRKLLVATGEYSTRRGPKGGAARAKALQMAETPTEIPFSTRMLMTMRMMA